MIDIAASPAFISVAGVDKTFRRRGQAVQALRTISLDVARGTFVSLLGPSGCGKSTLLRVIGGLQDADRGSVTIGGTDAHTARSTKQFGLVPQAPALVPWKTVEHNVRFLAELHAGAKSHAPMRESEIAELLDTVGLAQFTRSYPHELSGGMQQRVSLVRAFACSVPRSC